MILETNDLIIRPSEWADLDDFYMWEQLPEVTEFFSIRDGQTMEDVVKKYVSDEKDPKAQQFTILLKQEEPDGFKVDDFSYGQTRKIGRIVLADIEDGWKGEIWRIYIGEKTLRGKGYGKQAMEAMMGYCFDVLGFERLYLDHYTGNPAAGLYLSLGFRYEGVLRKNCRKNGILYDVHLMSMLREEYENLFKK
ncbi:MAG: GNAT family protein [Firmicutes bacterium]|nr:GNAT family protein [Bacillota bacterium]